MYRGNLRKLIISLMAGSTIPAALAASPDVKGLRDFYLEKENLQQSVPAYSDPLGSRGVLDTYINQYPAREFSADYIKATNGLNEYLSDARSLVADFAMTPDMRRCLINSGTGPDSLEESLGEAESSKADIDAYLMQSISLRYKRSNYDNVAVGAKDITELDRNLKRVETAKKRMRECCVDPLDPSNRLNGCPVDVAERLREKKDYASVTPPRGNYSMPPENMPPEELAFFIRNDPVLRDAMARADGSDFSGLDDAWSHVKTQCSRDVEYVISERIRKMKSVKSMSEIAKAVQCTLPSIMAQNGSYGFFQASLMMASVPVRNQYVQFGCSPELLQSLSEIRTTDHAKLQEKWGTDSILPQWVLTNYNELPVQRRSFAQKVDGGWASSSGFVPDVQDSGVLLTNNRAPSNAFPANLGSQVPVNGSTVGFAGASSSRIAQSRGTAASRRGRGLVSRDFVSDSQKYALSTRKLASKIANGEEPEKNARLLAQGSGGTKEFVGGISRSLASRGASNISAARRSLAESGRSGVRRVATSRALSSAARTTASDMGSIIAKLRETAPSGPVGNAPTAAPATPTTSVANSASNWDKGGPSANFDPFAKLRATQKSLDTQISAKNSFIDAIVAKINEAANEYGEAKRRIVNTYSAPLINSKISGKAPKEIVSIMGSIRAEAFGELTQLGALNSRVNELKTQLMVEESTMSNLLRMRGAAAGQVTPFNSATFPGFAGNTNAGAPGFPQVQSLPQQNPFAGVGVDQQLQQRGPASSENPFTSMNLIEAFLPKAWAIPSSFDQLKSFEIWEKAVSQYHLDLQSFAQKASDETQEAKTALYEGYREYFDSQHDPEKMLEMRSDLVAGIGHYNNTVKEETQELLKKLNANESAENVNREVINLLEQAKNDSDETEKALIKILKVYIESYPSALEDHPEMWWSQTAELLLY